MSSDGTTVTSSTFLLCTWPSIFPRSLELFPVLTLRGTRWVRGNTRHRPRGRANGWALLFSF